jgi:hypothetical protein
MTPSADPATVAAPGLTVVPARLLDGGEVVILAVKPSGWFCLLTSLPVLTVAGIFVVAVGLAGPALPGPLSAGAVMLFWVSVSALRLAVAWVQWMGRLYILTNRRILCVSGTFRREICQCPLKLLAGAVVSASVPERLLGVGNLSFESSDPSAQLAPWACINNPPEVQQIVREAISRAR